MEKEAGIRRIRFRPSCDRREMRRWDTCCWDTPAAKGLGVFPFYAVDISLIEKPFREVLEDDCAMTRSDSAREYPPTWGGDIVSGLYDCRFDTN